MYGLKCSCALNIDGVELLSLHGCVNNTCETNSGVCLVNLQTRDGHAVQKFDCLNNSFGVSAIALACAISRPDHVTQCCNETDYCNVQLSPTLLSVPVSYRPTPTTGSKGTHNLYYC